MITFKLEIDGKEKEYSFKNTLDDITIEDYFEISKIVNEKIEKPVDESKRFVDGTYKKEYYTNAEEPADIKLSKRIDVIVLLSKVDKQLFLDYPELLLELEERLEPLNTDDAIWKKTPHFNYKKLKGQAVKEKVETNFEWTYDDVKQWSFQQWVDAENASKTSLIYPFLIAIYKREKGTQKKRKYDRAHPDWEDKEEFWLKQPCRNHIATILHILNEMANVRDMWFYVYKAKSNFEDKSERTAQNEYSDFAGWNDVVVSLAENNYFTSPTGTLNGVRTANCIEVLELLNWKRGKSFAEYEDYKVEERSKEIANQGKKR